MKVAAARVRPRRSGRKLVLHLCALAAGPQLTLAPAASQTADIGGPLRAVYDSAYFAWDRGDYPQALEQVERLLAAPGADALLDNIALLTGELYEVVDVASDGQFVGWSPDGRYLSFETGTGGDVRTHLVAVGGGGAEQITSFAGWDAHFSPDGSTVAYLRVPVTPELTRAREAVRGALAAGDRAALNAARRELAILESGTAEIALRDIADGSDEVIRAEGIERFGLAYAGDGSLILVGRRTGAEGIDLFQLSSGRPPRQLSEGPGNKGRQILTAGVDRLVYTVDDDGIAIQDLRTGGGRMIEGRAPAVSRDGSTLAYLVAAEEPAPELRRGEAVVGADLRASGRLERLMVLSLDDPAAEPRELKRTTLPIASPALSPSGEQVAFNLMQRDDWDVFVMRADGTDERRVTRDIQHDLFPQFLAEDRLLTLMGEARHRRSYLHDLSTDGRERIAANALPGDDQRGRQRLFHNNSIRTVAPQYEWVPSPDGTRVAVVADRDGDTLSPERGVYVVDLERRVTRDDLVARVRGQRVAEMELRSWGADVFAPIRDQAADAVADVEIGRIYDHAHALYQFDSKFITQPGNALAIDYLTSALRVMGYEPELQWFEPRPGIRSANVVATLRGTQRPDRIHVASSHFDSVEGSPGADDNSSGTTALLEAARVLASRPQPETIRFAFFTGEEAGLLGGREFVRRALDDDDIIVSALNNDMIGWTRSHRLDNTIRYSNDTIRDLQHSAAILFTDLITYDARYVRSTDAQAFWDAYGDIVGGIGSYPILGNPHYHQRHDRLEVINHRLVAEVSKTTIATLMRLAQGLDLEQR